MVEMAGQQQQTYLPDSPTSMPNGPEVGDASTRNPLVPSDGSINASSTRGPTALSKATLPSVEEDRAHPSDSIPQWGMRNDPDISYLDSIFFSNDLDLDDLNLSLLNATGEYPVQSTMGDTAGGARGHLDQPTSHGTTNGFPTVDPQSTIQLHWHTYCGHASSGNTTPDPSHDPDGVDEACHRTLSDKLQPRVQHGTLPSTSFLVRKFTGDMTPYGTLSHPEIPSLIRHALELMLTCIFQQFPSASTDCPCANLQAPPSQWPATPLHMFNWKSLHGLWASLLSRHQHV